MHVCSCVLLLEFTHIFVSPGIGTRNYYRKLGYHLASGKGEFMVKRIPWHSPRRLLHASLAPYSIAAIVAVLAIFYALCIRFSSMSNLQ